MLTCSHVSRQRFRARWFYSNLSTSRTNLLVQPYDRRGIAPLGSQQIRCMQTFSEEDNLAVAGGGITGLVSAHQLSDKFPNRTITLFEASSRLGGWIRTKQVGDKDGQVLFEKGPRTLRPRPPDGWLTLNLVSHELCWHPTNRCSSKGWDSVMQSNGLPRLLRQLVIV